MIALSSIDDIFRLYEARGQLHYGEGVTQLEHALQCAVLAEEQNLPSDQIVAALLHDVGHLLEDEAEAMAGADRVHERLGANALRALFDDRVCQPIALHVTAKRYLCFAEPSYSAALSEASQRSLMLQGGPLEAA